MAVKAGQIIHVGNGTTLIDRLQTGGPGQLNIPVEKIYELGNYKSVGQIRDTPDLQFDLESYDVGPEIEALITGSALGANGIRSVTDGAITAAAANLTSATAAFVTGTHPTGDVGRQVVVFGAGTGGADLVTTISSVTNATTAVLATNAGTTVSGAVVYIAPNGIDLASGVPMDIASQWKGNSNSFNVVNSVALPFLYAESVSYRFGYRDNSSQAASMRGDAIFYNPGSTYTQTAAGSNAANQTVVTTQPAYASSEDGRRIISVTVNNVRLTKDVDYTESYGTITSGAAVTTITFTTAYGPIPTSQTIRIMYASPTALTYNQATHATVTGGTFPSVRPAAVRGRDIDIYLGTTGASFDPNNLTTSAQYRLKGIQNVNVDWRVNIDKNNEFGNYFAVNQDFDVPTVNGSITFRPNDPADLYAFLRKITGAAANTMVGASTSTPLVLDIVIKDPATGKGLKRINVPDARFTLPGFSGRAQQKVDVTANFESDAGSMLVYLR